MQMPCSSSPLLEDPNNWREKEMPISSFSSLAESPSSRKWRFTWETLGHFPTLRLFLFNPEVSPSMQFENLRSSLDFENSVLIVTWSEKIEDVGDGACYSDFLLRVPLPRVLVDPGSVVDSTAHEDHIEVKIALILPVEHPLAVAALESVLDLTEEDTSERKRGISGRFLPLSLASDGRYILAVLGGKSARFSLKGGNISSAITVAKQKSKLQDAPLTMNSSPIYRFRCPNASLKRTIALLPVCPNHPPLMTHVALLYSIICSHERHMLYKFPFDYEIAFVFTLSCSLRFGDSERDPYRNRFTDLKSLSSNVAGGGVHFYCKHCSAKLTKDPLRSFVEMPSVNWQDVADNWFGACCCSFGGASERLVSEYINSNVWADGACLIDDTSVIIFKDNLAECIFSDFNSGEAMLEPKLNLVKEVDLTDGATEAGSQGECGLGCVNGNEGILDICQTLSRTSLTDKMLKLQNSSCCTSLSAPDCSEKMELGTNSCFVENNDIAYLSSSKAFSVSHENSLECTSRVISGDISTACRGSPTDELSTKDHCCIAGAQFLINHAEQGTALGVSIPSKNNAKSQANLKHLRVGTIGGGFMIRNVHLPKDIKWAELLCHQCSSLLGSYPLAEDSHAPVDGGIRLFKCCISTSLPVGESDDIFRNHTLQRVFVTQLLDSAMEELSFRTVIRDLKTKSPMLQIVIVNSKVWCSTGFCLDAENGSGPASKIDLHPVVKVLYSDCSVASEAELRAVEEWQIKNHADESYMMQCQIKQLIESLKSVQDGLPNSRSFLQGFSLSSMER